MYAKQLGNGHFLRHAGRVRLMWTCSNCGFVVNRPRFPLHCRCGGVDYGDRFTSGPPQVELSPEAIKSRAALCLACPFARPHDRAGLRCTHKRCKCGQGEQEIVELVGVAFNGGLARRIKLGRCPDGRW